MKYWYGLIFYFSAFFFSSLRILFFFVRLDRCKQTVNADKRIIKILCMRNERATSQLAVPVSKHKRSRNQHFCNWYSFFSISPEEPRRKYPSWIIWILSHCCWYLHKSKLQWNMQWIGSKKYYNRMDLNAIHFMWRNLLNCVYAHRRQQQRRTVFHSMHADALVNLLLLSLWNMDQKWKIDSIARHARAQCWKVPSLTPPQLDGTCFWIPKRLMFQLTPLEV